MSYFQENYRSTAENFLKNQLLCMYLINHLIRISIWVILQKVF